MNEKAWQDYRKAYMVGGFERDDEKWFYVFTHPNCTIRDVIREADVDGDEECIRRLFEDFIEEGLMVVDENGRYRTTAVCG